MIQNLTTSDLNAILARLKTENSGLWYKIEMNSNGEQETEKLKLEYDKNKSLIEKIEKEIDSRIEKIKM